MDVRAESRLASRAIIKCSTLFTVSRSCLLGSRGRCRTSSCLRDRVSNDRDNRQKGFVQP